MKTNLFIVTGFIGSGKTKFINTVVKNTKPNDFTLVIQCEKGVTEIEQITENIISINLSQEKICTDLILNEINKYNPQSVIIECNGSVSILPLIKILNGKKLKNLWNSFKVFNVIDTDTFNIFVHNMTSLILEPVIFSNYILLKERNKDIERLLKKENPRIKFYSFKELTNAEVMQKTILNNNHVLWQDKVTKVLILIFIFLVLLMVMHGIGIDYEAIISSKIFLRFTLTLSSILVETIPFIMLGTFISSFIQIYVSEDSLARFIPNNKFLSLLFASVIGFIFPICECAIIPITKRLIKKGLPLDVAIVFMLSVPIINPITIMSTHYAFYGMNQFVIFRVGFGMLCSITIGYGVSKIYKGTPFLDDTYSDIYYSQTIPSSKFISIIEHTSYEFTNTFKYLVFGAIISASFQSLVGNDVISSFGGNKVISIIVMMLLAFIISLCSEADAFVARAFLGGFSSGSIISFLILGPMLDIKNLLMLSESFKKQFVLKLVLLIIIVVFCLGLFVNFTMLLK